ncbi:MAG: VOC family protein [Beijerinckiaceae bacterium]
MKLWLDHIVIAARTLAEGCDYVRDALGVEVPAGGSHTPMNTHNRLLRLGDDLFLEVIAIDPDAGPPPRPRWFALDDDEVWARLAAGPAFHTWVLRTDDLDAALAAIPRAGRPAISASRGALSWRIAVPPDGAIVDDGAFPTFMQWPDIPHPASRMTDLGCTLRSFTVGHPDSEQIAADLAPGFADRRVIFAREPVKQLSAVIATPHGERTLA